MPMKVGIFVLSGLVVIFGYNAFLAQRDAKLIQAWRECLRPNSPAYCSFTENTK